MAGRHTVELPESLRQGPVVAEGMLRLGQDVLLGFGATDEAVMSPLVDRGHDGIKVQQPEPDELVVHQAHEVEGVRFSRTHLRPTSEQNAPQATLQLL